MGAEKSGVGAASIRRRQVVVPTEGPGLGDLRTKPISMMGTERQQTVQSHVSGVLALREHLLVTNRPLNAPSLGAARPRVRSHDHRPVSIEPPRSRPAPRPLQRPVLSPRWFAG